ncbi:MAG: ImmA/IrrE family metallo-endopeptidase [Propionibacteriaceae bacterium]|nr:ImmA/IrrE family metallo-endopeptidase [Propionibacteriaceae bacterium]
MSGFFGFGRDKKTEAPVFTDEIVLPDGPTESLSLEQRELIVKLAEALADDFVATAAEHKWYNPSLYPVDLVSITQGLGIAVWPSDMDGNEGAISKSAGQLMPEVAISNALSPQSRLFTLAHELGHWQVFIQGKTEQQIRETAFGDIRVKSEGDRNPREYLANSFAHYVLMPTEEILMCIVSNMTFDDMRVHFGVSEESMMRRLSYFNLEQQPFGTAPDGGISVDE